MARPLTGSIEKLPSGKYSVRLTHDGGKRTRLGPYATEDEAVTMRNEAVAAIARPPGGPTLAEHGPRWMHDRHATGDLRSPQTEISLWRTHVSTAKFVDAPMASVTRDDVLDWIAVMRRKRTATPTHKETRPLSRNTIGKALLLVRQMLDAARLPTNPCVGIKLPREKRTHNPWTYLQLDEQKALLLNEQIPEPDRLIMQFAIGTGLRSGEQFNGYLRDLFVDCADEDAHFVVRYGSKDRSTKSGKIRTIPIFGLALQAARRWLQLLPTYCPSNPEGLIFPTPSGMRRHRGRNVQTRARKPGQKTLTTIDTFKHYLALSGIVAHRRHDGRPLRWHDLRHTCASALISGMWGEPWSIEEIRGLLGHSSSTMTERYAHLGKRAMNRAASRTHGFAAAPVASAA